MRWGKVAGIAGALMLTSACTTASLKELRRVEPTGEAFSAALSHNYLMFAEKEAADYDWIDSKYFADKGLRAAYGKNVQPEDPARWDLPAHARTEVQRARARLLAQLTPQKKQQQPQQAAKAQFMLDCWMEELEEKWQEANINACREGFLTAVRTLEGAPVRPEVAAAAKPLPAKASPEPVRSAKPETPSVSPAVAQTPKRIVEAQGDSAGDTPADAPSPDAPRVALSETATDTTPRPQPLFTTTSYLVFFDVGNTVLGEDAQQVIESVMQDLKQLGEYEIIINGHTDRLGDAERNLELSQQRAKNVEAALIKRGVPKDLITVFAFGESDPKIVTGDGTSERHNRRVEIFLSN